VILSNGNERWAFRVAVSNIRCGEPHVTCRYEFAYRTWTNIQSFICLLLYEALLIRRRNYPFWYKWLQIAIELNRSSRLRNSEQSSRDGLPDRGGKKQGCNRASAQRHSFWGRYPDRHDSHQLGTGGADSDINQSNEKRTQYSLQWSNGAPVEHSSAAYAHAGSVFSQKTQRHCRTTPVSLVEATGGGRPASTQKHAQMPEAQSAQGQREAVSPVRGSLFSYFSGPTVR